jgi:hypothetical protein
LIARSTSWKKASRTAKILVNKYAEVSRAVIGGEVEELIGPLA